MSQLAVFLPCALGACVLLQALAGTPEQATSINRHLTKLAGAAPLRMRFQGRTAEDCRLWQAAFSAKLKSLLGDYQPPRTWRVLVERTVKLPDHHREELLLLSDGLPALPVHVLVPKLKNKERRPGIVALHGHGAFGADAVVGRELTVGIDEEIKRANYDYGRQLVRRGYVVAAPCLTPFGRRLGDRKGYGGNDPCAVTFIRLQLLGKLLIAENLRDVLWSLDLLARRSEVDAERLGCVGLSYGGRMTMLAAAVEPRIKVAIISGALNCLQERIRSPYSCGAQVIPGLLQHGDVPEIAALMAPRLALWEVGTEDPLLPPDWVDAATSRMKRAYVALGAHDQLRVHRFAGGHRWHGEQGFRLLKEELKDKSQAR